MKKFSITISIASYYLLFFFSVSHASDGTSYSDDLLLKMHAMDSRCSARSRRNASLIEDRMRINPNEEIVSVVCNRHTYHNRYAVYWLKRGQAPHVTRLTFSYQFEGTWKRTQLLSRVSLKIGQLKLSSIEKWDRAPSKYAPLSPWTTGSASIYQWSGKKFELIRYHVKTVNDGKPFLFFEDQAYNVDLSGMAYK